MSLAKQNRTQYAMLYVTLPAQSFFFLHHLTTRKYF